MRFFALTGGGVDISDSETAGFLLFFVGLVMGPIMAILLSSLVRAEEDVTVRMVQKAGVVSFMVTSLCLLALFAFDLSGGIGDILFTLSGFSAIVFAILVVMLMVHTLKLWLIETTQKSGNKKK